MSTVFKLMVKLSSHPKDLLKWIYSSVMLTQKPFLLQQVDQSCYHEPAILSLSPNLVLSPDLSLSPELSFSPRLFSLKTVISSFILSRKHSPKPFNFLLGRTQGPVFHLVTQEASSGHIFY